ncbi:MAG: hypothetical protein V1645_02185 [archaeon]
MKKGAYDLGRKALYYLVALVIIALIFLYTSNAIYKYQKKGFENLDGISKIGTINKINSCFYYEDKEIERIYANTVDMEKFTQENLNNCADKPMIVTLTKLGAQPKIMTMSYKADMLREKQKARRLVTIIEKGEKEEGLLQVEMPK